MPGLGLEGVGLPNLPSPDLTILGLISFSSSLVWANQLWNSPACKPVHPLLTLTNKLK